jgi:ATP-binding cassette subfamily B protein
MLGVGFMRGSAHLDSAKSSDGLRPLRLLWPYLRPYRLQMLGALIALSVAGGTFLVIPKGLSYVIDQGLMASNPHMLDVTLRWLLLAVVVLAAATFARYALVTWLGERVVADLRRAIYAHILELSLSFFEVTRAGDILSRLSVDTSVLQSLIGSSVSVAMRNCVLLAGGCVMMALTSPKLTAYTLIVIPAVVIPIKFFGRKVRRTSKALQESIADLNANAEETVYGIRTLQAFVHEELSRNDFNARAEGVVAAAVRFIRVRATLTALIIFLVFSMIGVVFWIGGHDLLRNEISAGQLLSFILYAGIAAGSIGAISEVAGDLQRAAGATERIFDLLAVAPTITVPTRPLALPPPKGELKLEGVTFFYPSRPDKAALKGMSFTVHPGERVAIVGPSGAGKTTLFQLVLRFYDPQQGVISFDGVDIKQTDPHDLRGRLGLVPQDPVIFSADAWHNIGYGREGASQDEIRTAAKAAHADGFLSSLPQGYASHLGEKGVRLSGGQKQRIAIARAILRNPSLLLLDEATSALDAESERLVQDALDHLMQGRTTLIIAHRLATVMNADRILVMEEGRIVASGTHQALIAEGGLYARFAKLQFEKAA